MPYMQLLEQAIDRAVDHLPLYWLVHNAAVATAQVSRQMIVSNQSQISLPHIIHAILAMEAHSLLQDPKFLSLRCTLVATACAAYTDLQQSGLAAKLVDHMMKQVTDTEQLLALDPVPQPKAIRNIFVASKDSLNSLKLPLELTSSPNEADATTKLSSLSTDRQKVVVLLDTLSSTAPRERVRVWRAALKPEQKVAMAVLKDTLLPKATAAINAVNAVANRAASESLAAAESDAAGVRQPAMAEGQPDTPAAGVADGMYGYGSGFLLDTFANRNGNSPAPHHVC